MSVCCISGCRANEIHQEAQFSGKTTQEIAKILSLADSAFAIHTPTFEKRLEPTTIPLQTYPELVLQKRPEKYPPPPYYLKVISNTDPTDLTLFFSIRTQMKTVFPSMAISFTADEIDRFYISDVLSRCISVFGYDCSDAKLMCDDLPLETTELAKDFISKAMEKPLIFECTVSEAPQKKINHRIFNTSQIISTEETYINDLNEIITYWEPAFREAKIFSDVEMRTLFRDVPTIRNSHNVFLDSLKSEPVTFASQIGHKFLAFVQFFKLSATFVSQYKSVDEMIKTKAKSRSFESKMKEVESKLPIGTGRDFLSYYITPVQRYPRYPLLIRDLDKVTPDFHPDKPYLAAAILDIDQVNKDIDRSSFTMKTLEVMDTLQKDFGSLVKINDPQRKLIFTASIRTNRPKLLNGTIFLFNNLVVVAAQPKKVYQHVYSTPVIKFRFVNSRPSQDSIMFYFDNRDYNIQFLDSEEKSGFIEAFHELRDQYLANLKLENAFVKWFDLDVADTVPALMNHDGCYLNENAFFFGGTTSSMVPSNSLIRYNFSANTWTITLGSPLPRDFHTTTAIDGVAYICFGNSKKEIFSDIWKFDEENRGWSQVTPQGEPAIKRMGHSAVAWGEKIIFFGGKDRNNNFMNDILVYNVNENTLKRFVNLPESPSPRAFHAACIIGNKMIISGGKTDKCIVGDVRTFDLEKWAWHSRPKLEIQDRMHHKMFAVGQWALILGGTSYKDCCMVECIDTKVWNIVPTDNVGNVSFSTSKFGAVQFESTKILIYGGVDIASKSPNSLVYQLDVSNLKPGKQKQKKARESVPASSKEEAASPSVPAQNPTLSSLQLIQPTLQQVQIQQKLQQENIIFSPKKQEQKQAEQTPNQQQKQLPSSEPPSQSAPSIDNIMAIKAAMKRKSQIINDSPNKASKTKEEEEDLAIKEAESTMIKDDEKIKLKEARKKAEEEAKKKVEEDLKKKAEEDSKKKAEEDSKKKAEEEAKKKVEEEAKKKVEEDSKKKVEEEAKKKAEEDSKKKAEEDSKKKAAIAEAGSSKKHASISRLANISTFNLDEIYNSLGIDVSTLLPFEQTATRMKARRLWQMHEANIKLEDKLREMEKTVIGKLSIAPDMPILIKVFDDLNQSTRIIRGSSSDTAEQITSQIFKTLGRSNAELKIVINREHKNTFNENSLAEALCEIYKGGVKCLKFIAI